MAAVMALLVLSVARAPVAAAQAPIECPDAEDAVSTFPPDFIREEASWVASAEVTFRTRIQNLVMSVDGEPTALTFDESGEARIIMPPVPPGKHEVVIIFEWDQDLGTQAACHGIDDYLVPYAEVSDTVGKTTTNRLEGTYRAAYTRGEGSATWRLSPSCDLLACSTRLRSNAGLRGTLKLRADGTYSFSANTKPLGNCTLRNVTTGAIVRTIQRAYIGHRLIVLRQGSETGEVAERMVGDITDTYRPTGRARRAGCTGTTRHLKVMLTRRA